MALMYFLLTRPLNMVMHQLDKISPDDLDRLEAPPGHQESEIGHLVGNINHLLAKIENHLIQERTLRTNLENATAEVKTLSGLLPICSSCKKIRDDKGYWNQLEAYIQRHSQAEFSHGICPECAKKLYPDLNISDD